MKKARPAAAEEKPTASAVPAFWVKITTAAEFPAEAPAFTPKIPKIKGPRI